MFETLKGQTIREIKGATKGSEEILIKTDTGSYTLWHEQNCCENVEVEEIVGDVEDLLNTEILLAEEAVNPPGFAGLDDGDNCESQTWTFYRLQTIKGSVVIRWLGSSNGNYSESVSFVQN